MIPFYDLPSLRGDHQAPPTPDSISTFPEPLTSLQSRTVPRLSDQSQPLLPYVPQYSLPQGRVTSSCGVTCSRASSHPGSGKLCLLREMARNSGKRSLIQEDSTYLRATKTWGTQLLSPSATTTETLEPRACALQQEMSTQWEAHAPQWEVALTHRNQRKPEQSKEDPAQPLKKKNSQKFPKR